MFYRIDTYSNCYEGFIVEAHSPEEAEEKLLEGIYTKKIYQDICDEEIQETNEEPGYKPVEHSTDETLEQLQALINQAQLLKRIKDVLNSKQ